MQSLAYIYGESYIKYLQFKRKYMFVRRHTQKLNYKTTIFACVFILFVFYWKFVKYTPTEFKTQNI